MVSASGQGGHLTKWSRVRLIQAGSWELAYATTSVSHFYCRDSESIALGTIMADEDNMADEAGPAEEDPGSVSEYSTGLFLLACSASKTGQGIYHGGTPLMFSVPSDRVEALDARLAQNKKGAVAAAMNVEDKGDSSSSSSAASSSNNGFASSKTGGPY